MPDWRITTDFYDGAGHPDRPDPRDPHPEPWDNPWADRFDKQLELHPGRAEGRSDR